MTRLRIRRQFVGRGVLAVTLIASVSAAPGRHSPTSAALADTRVHVAHVTACTWPSAPATCKGVLPRTFLTKHPNGQLLVDMMADQLEKATKVPRQTQCVWGPCAKSQMANAYVNPDARSIDLTKLPDDQVVVVGSFRMKSGVDKLEKRYGVGRNLAADEKIQRYFFVVYKPTAAGTDPTYGVNIAGWVLYGVTKYGTTFTADSLNSGTIVRCTKEHDNNYAEPNARFLNCEADRIVNKLSAESGVSRDKLLDARACEASALQCALRADRLFATVPTLSVSARKSLVARLAAAVSDSSIDPYWFTCAVGCCTAEM